MQWFGMGVFLYTAIVKAACDEDGVPHEDVLHDDKGVPNEDEDVLHEDEGVSNEDEGVLSEDESWPNEDEGVPHEGVNEYEGVPNEYEGVPNEDDSEDGMHFEYEDDPVFHENDMEERNTQTDEDIDVLSEEENNEVIHQNMVEDASMDEIENIVEDKDISEGDETEADSTCNDTFSGSDENARMNDNEDSQANQHHDENDESTLRMQC